MKCSFNEKYFISNNLVTKLFIIDEKIFLIAT